MTDLSLVPEDEIWEELKRRSDGVLLVTMKILDSESEATEVFFHGGRITAIGMAQVAKQTLLEMDQKGVAEE